VSIIARLRRAVQARGHFPTEQAAIKCLYLTIMSLDATPRGHQRWTNRRKAALNAFDITFDCRLSARTGQSACARAVSAKITGVRIRHGGSVLSALVRSQAPIKLSPAQFATQSATQFDLVAVAPRPSPGGPLT
jgi:hypothetical protein